MARHRETHDYEVWLAHLRKLPFAKRVDFHPAGEHDGRVVIHTPSGKAEYQAEATRTNPLGYTVLEALIARAAREEGSRWIFLAPYLTPQLGERLRQHGIDYVDAAGNHHIRIGNQYLAQVEGKKLAKGLAPRSEKLRTAAYQVMFTLAARPELASAPVRELARLAGTGKTAAAETIRRLLKEGLLLRSSRGTEVVRREQLLERWLSGYEHTIRARWVQGRYRSAHASTEDLEADVERSLSSSVAGIDWVWGGAAAEMRLLHYYRGEETTLHIRRPAPQLAKHLRALPDPNGPLTIMVTPMPLAFQGRVPHTAHPLLIYSELLAAPDERAKSAAERVRREFLEKSR